MISGVLDRIVTSEDADSEDSPSLLTMLRWLQWFRMNFANIEGFLRNAGYRILGLGEELLFSHASLLDTIHQTHQDWLERILRIIYNSGGFLPAVP